MLFVIFLFEWSNNLCSILGSSTLIGIKYKVDIFTLVFVFFDFDWAELVDIKQFNYCLPVYLSINTNLTEELLFNTVIVDVHKPCTFFLPLLLRDFVLRRESIKNVILHFKESSVIYSLVHEIEKQLLARRGNSLRIHQLKHVWNRQLILGLYFVGLLRPLHHDFESHLLMVSHVFSFSIMGVVFKSLSEIVFVNRHWRSVCCQLWLGMLNVVNRFKVFILQKQSLAFRFHPRQVWLDWAQKSFRPVFTCYSLKLHDVIRSASNFVVLNLKWRSVISIRIVLINPAVFFPSWFSLEHVFNSHFIATFPLGLINWRQSSLWVTLRSNFN